MVARVEGMMGLWLEGLTIVGSCRDGLRSFLPSVAVCCTRPSRLIFKFPLNIQ